MDTIGKKRVIEDILNWLGTGTILILGRPYSGKSYQAKKLGEMLGLPILDSGEVLRAMRSELPPEEVATQDAGGLISTDVFLKALLPLIESMPAGQGAIFCSVGKKNGEQRIVMSACEQADRPIKAVIHIKLSRGEAIARWRDEQTKGPATRELRTDDASERQQEDRHNVFASETMPVMQFYLGEELLVEVDGGKPKSQVTEEVIAVLYKLARDAQTQSLDSRKMK